MTETAAPVAKPFARPRSRKTATVSASALAQHLDCTRTYIGKLEAEGVIQRQGDDFPLDKSRVAYVLYLRRERRQSPRAEADAEHAKAKAELLRLRIAEKQHELVPRADFDAMIDGIAGVVLTHLSGMAARCSNDLAVRRKIDAVVYEVRKEMAKVALRWPTRTTSRWSSRSRPQMLRSKRDLAANADSNQYPPPATTRSAMPRARMIWTTAA